MRSKLWGALLLVVVFMFGCGSKEASEPVEQTLIEEESTTGEELSFALINDSITMECGIPFDEDISKYVRTDNIENIEMEIDDTDIVFERNFDTLGFGKEIDYIIFKDKVTQDELVMTVNFEDTVAPFVIFENEDTLPYYTMQVVPNYSNEVPYVIAKKSKESGVGNINNPNLFFIPLVNTVFSRGF